MLLLRRFGRCHVCVCRGAVNNNHRSLSGAQRSLNANVHLYAAMTANLDLNHIAAPMVNQSDTPFRALVHNHGATLTYTEMLRPARLLSDPDYLAFHRRALELGRSSAGPVIVQVCGNDQDVIVRGARTVVDLCDGIGRWLIFKKQKTIISCYGRLTAF